jgi:hypothetical protein
LEALNPILYFSIFNYPLTKEEIYLYSKLEDYSSLETDLETLINLKAIEKTEGFHLYNARNGAVSKRQSGNKKAQEMLPKALKRARFISKFPYIESVSISGALSKGYYDDDGDFDFFLITKPNRLWVSRTLLILYKKLFLGNSKKYFCVNYFISSDTLEISEQNLFTATELLTLIPASGKSVFNEFLATNLWATEHLPNLKVDTSTIKEVKPFYISKITERIFNTKIGTWTDNSFRKLTVKRWTSKFSYLEKKEFEIALKSTKTVSKHHPQNFQKKVIDAFNLKRETFEKKYNTTQK